MNNQHNNTSLTNCPACQTAVSRQAASCPRCGQPLRTASYQQPQFQQNFAPPVAKKGGIGKTFGVGCLGLIGFFMVVGLIGSVAVPKRNDVQNQSNTQAATVSQTPQTTPSPIQQTKNVKSKKAPQTTQVEGYRMEDADGYDRGYSLTCLRQAEELKQVPFRVKNFVFEKCIEFKGDGDAAKRLALYALQ